MGREDGFLLVIQTWHRPDYLELLLDQVMQFTKTKFELVVSTADEDEEAIRICEERGVTCFHSLDRGVGRSRNQGYWYFWEHTQYDVVIMLEDDCRVWEVGWEEEWIAAANRWGMICYAYNNKKESRGNNRWDDPIWTTDYGFHATAFNRGAMSLVGFSDPVFGGYGFDDTELAWRYYRALRAEGSWAGQPLQCHPCLSCHIGVLFDHSFFNPTTFNENQKLLKKIQADPKSPVGKWYPWISPSDRELFLSGIRPHIPKSNTNKPGKCVFCGGNGREIGRKDGYPLRSCHGLTMSFPYKSEAEYESIYTEGEYHDKIQEQEGQLDYWSRDKDLLIASESRMKLLRAMGIAEWGNKFLDVGAGTGALVHKAHEHGLKSLGVDPSERVVLEAKAKGRTMQVGDAYNLPDGDWDVIYMSDVFEHLTRPKEALRTAWDHLAKDGTLIIEMPEEGCPQAQQQGMKWRHYRPTQHVYLYNEGAIRSLAVRYGFYVEAVTRPLRGSIGKFVVYLRKTESSLQ